VSSGFRPAVSGVVHGLQGVAGWPAGSPFPAQVPCSCEQRARVIPEGAGPCQAAGMQSFVPVFRRLRACRAGPAGVPGAWLALFPDSCPSLVSGRAGSRTGRSLAGGARAPQASLTLPAASR